MRRAFLSFSVLFCSAVLIFFPTAGFSASKLHEYEIKAAFLYQFTHFVEWPDNSQGTPRDFGICVAGKDPFEGILQQLEARGDAPRPIRIHHIRSAQDAAPCAIIFLSRQEEEKAQSFPKELAGLPVLTVSEVPGFVQNGGMINFIEQERKIGFEINQKNAHAAGIRISSKLLKLAQTVIT